VLEKMNTDDQEPAYVAFKNWKPSTSTHDL